jgi:predicted phage terminase large subunit-like protein
MKSATPAKKAKPVSAERRKIILPRLHAAQIQIVDTPSRFKVIAAGRRFGKGILGTSELFKRGIMGKKCRWISPNYASDSFQSGWAMAVNLANQIPGVRVHLQRREFNFKELGGAWLQFRTAEEPDSLRGEGIDFAIFDEAAHVKGLKEIWEQSVRPSLMDRKGGAWFISTPKGFNFFNELFNRGRNKEKDWASFHFTSHDNPNIAPEEIEALKKDMPALVARQEIDAEFVQLAGALFKRENIIVIENEPPGLRWVRAWDLAFTTKTTSDFTAGGKMAMDSNGMIILSDVVHGRMEWPDALKAIANTSRIDGPQVRVGIESVGAQVGMIQELLRDPTLANVAIQPIEVKGDKLFRALSLIARSEQKKFAIVRASWNMKFLDELCSFSGDKDEHDDMVDMATSGLKMISDPTGAFSSASDILTGKTGDIETPEAIQTDEVDFDNMEIN